MKRYFPVLVRIGAIFGGIVAALILIRSSKRAKATGAPLGQTVVNELKSVTALNVVLAIVAGFAALYSYEAAATGMLMAVVWGTIPASSAASFNITYIPQFISFISTAAPTSFQINVQGDGVIFNLNAAGVGALQNIRKVGVQTNEYVFQLADGLINGKNGTVSITNAAAAVLTVNAWSRNWGGIYNVHMSQRALQSSGIRLRKLAYAAFPSAAIADSFTLEFNNGLTQVGRRDELQAMLGYTQNQVAGRYNVDNIAPAILDTLTFIPAADQDVFVMNYQAAKGTVNNQVLSRG